MCGSTLMTLRLGKLNYKFAYHPSNTSNLSAFQIQIDRNNKYSYTQISYYKGTIIYHKEVPDTPWLEIFRYVHKVCTPAEIYKL